MGDSLMRTFFVNTAIMLAYSGAGWFGASLFGDWRADLVVLIQWLAIVVHLFTLLIMAKTHLLGTRTEDADSNIMVTMVLIALAGHFLLAWNALQHAHIH